MGKTHQQRGQGTSGKISDYLEEDQPLWACRMEETFKTTMEELKAAVTFNGDQLRDHIKNTDERFKEANERMDKIDERMDELEYHERKYNLLFFGLQPSGNADCEVTVRNFLRGRRERHAFSELPRTPE